MLAIGLSQAEPRFLWNNYMLELLIDKKVSLMPKLLLPLRASFSYIFNVYFTVTAEHLCGFLLQLDPFLLPVVQGNILIALLISVFHDNGF